MRETKKKKKKNRRFDNSASLIQMGKKWWKGKEMQSEERVKLSKELGKRRRNFIKIFK